ncbi:3'(2'),5'-bisphosphate nucleotidase CysQ [Sphingomonas psychrotolerans]|uniref:3'(2'),5'-bisphosphate nucleotidase CysQ n=1 Tax=Sphingomonas psychrotolerans TaxID=1327635 RepID=A0ABU3N875_9SPHN|nr:3'(2'),5'-bisphosphate nucleotidase CysQ [Sphingomonas psychrotolerans]MDT8759691.1 3'(2'),5'-bisphosphate nucleotidase CysQ [Sphingomonas psychrotolerans]
MTDAELARDIAAEAGALLLRIQQECASGDRGDREANMLILDRLRAARPGDAILSEESADDPARLARSRVWIVDPLDGTREFAERREDWAVHVALAVDGRAEAGAVALPRLGLTLSSDTPPALTEAQVPPRLLVSRSRPSALCVDVAERIGAVSVGMGSAGAKAMAVVRGEAEIYLHSGGQHQWDNCAPVAVALAAGLHASRIDGSPIVYNERPTDIPDLLICRKEWADTVLSAVRECASS